MELTLDDVRADVTSRLTDAARNRRSPMHTPVVATQDADVRIMVLRAFDPDGWTLRFHTDARAPKIALLDNGAAVGVLFYDAQEKVQIRCKGTARIESDSELAEDAWNASSAFARRCYLGQPPGEQSNGPASGLPANLEGVKPDEDTLVGARQNFAILLVQIETADWYSLKHTGHRRALLAREKAYWLTP